MTFVNLASLSSLVVIFSACGSIAVPGTDAADSSDAGVTADASGAADAAAPAPDAGIPAPRLTNVVAPPVPAGSEGQVAFEFVGVPDETVTVAVSAGAGSFAPSTADVVLDAAGIGAWQTTFSAPSAVGESSHQITLSDLRGANETSVFTVEVTAAEFRVGNTMEFADDASFGPNFLLGQRFSLSQPGRLVRLGVIESAAGAKVRLALYKDGANRPTSLVTATPVHTLTVGVNEIPVMTETDLAPGAYWITGVYDIQSLGRQNLATTTTTVYVSHAFDAALPSSFPAAASSYSGGLLNYYMVLLP